MADSHIFQWGNVGVASGLLIRRLRKKVSGSIPLAGAL